MASDLAPSVNGMYGGQYGQPAELAASVPPSTQDSATTQTSVDATATTNAVPDPQQIGWYFVKEYYTTLSEHPGQLHLFYSKKSQLVTGVEAERVLPSVSSKAIKDKIKELDIQDCKVRVLNVDSQTSLTNIVIQVIGLMSNKSAPRKKFVQTFVLTPQTNGYYVLNDIFRYLNDEEDEIIDDLADPQGVPAEAPSSAGQAEDAKSEPKHDLVDNEVSAEQVDAKLEEVADTEAPPSVNGDHVEANSEAPPVETEPSEVAEPASEEAVGESVEEATEETTEEAVEEVPEEASLPIAAESPREPEPTPAQSPPQAAAPAPAPEAVPSKKTWANLVGSKATAVPAVPTATSTIPSQPKAQRSSTPVTQPQPNNATVEPGTSPVSSGNEWQTADHSRKQSKPQSKAASEGNVLGYIKNVTDKIEASKLRNALEKFGDVKYFDVSRPRNCAFIEFATPAGYNAAVAANPHQIGSEQIYVEERRPRPNAFGGSNSGFNRGGANGGRGRGGVGLQGRTSSQSGSFPKDAGRGTFQPRGAKSGNVTPRGRGGQAQPV